jgi:hypothetical protein
MGSSQSFIPIAGNVISTRRIQGNQQDIGFPFRGVFNLDLLILIITLPHKKNKEQDEENKRDTQVNWLQTNDSFPPHEESIGQGRQEEKYEKAKDRAKYQKEGAGVGGYLQNRREDCFTPVESECSNNP